MEKHLEVSLTASYCTLNELTPKTRRVWIAFHGYGMLAKYFIRKFEKLDATENFIIAPQGLSKFYLEGFTGRVGASWMTKEDRLSEIDNQVTYVNQVLANEKINTQKVEIILFGFSQGVATACRYGAFSPIAFQKLILWAGTFPPDIPSEKTKHWGKQSEIIYFTGNHDPFFKEEMIDQQNQQVQIATGSKPQLVRFEGKHEVLPELLKGI